MNYSSKYITTKKSYNQINLERMPNPSNQSKQRSSSTNQEKMKSQAKVPQYNTVMKKTNNHVLKSISVNKQIQYQKKNLSKNNENNFFYSYNGFSGFKVTTTTNANNTNDKITKSYINVNNITNPKNGRVSQLDNFSNNKLRRKMILSVDLNNKKNGKNMSQYDLNNIKFITEYQSDSNNNKNTENNISNPMSNGAKDNFNNNIRAKQKSISVNHMTKNYSQNNLVKSPVKKYNSNILTKYVDISDKKERNSKNFNTNSNNYSNNNINVNKKTNVKQSLKLLDQQNNINLILPDNYQPNHTTANNEKKYIKPNLKNSNTTFYKLNHANSSKYNIYDNNNNNNNYKIMKDIVEIQNELEKKLKDNVTNSKSKKYNTLKHTFETLLKYLGNTIFKSNNVIINVLLEKILIGYHEVVSAFSAENRKLKQINYDLSQQYEKMCKESFNSNKIIKEKQKLIESLQKKIALIEKGNKKNAFQCQKNNNLNIINYDNINKDDQNQKVFELNKKNVEDLDALYFYDKIKDSKKRAISIPKIVIQQQECQDEEEEEENEYEEMNKTVIFSNIWGLFIGLGDIKFNSPTFIKIRDAFLL